MSQRRQLPDGERAVRSRLAQIVASYPLVKGGLVSMSRVCGNPRCRCAKGEKHVSLYVSVRVGKARKMIYVPSAWEETIRRWVETGRQAAQLMDEISQACLQRFLKKKEKGEVPEGDADSDDSS